MAQNKDFTNTGYFSSGAMPIPGMPEYRNTPAVFPGADIGTATEGAMRAADTSDKIMQQALQSIIPGGGDLSKLIINSPAVNFPAVRHPKQIPMTGPSTNVNATTAAGQRRNDLNSLIHGVGNLVSAGINRKRAKEDQELTNDLALIQMVSSNPTDPHNQAILEQIASDPKRVKRLQKAIGYNPFSGEPPSSETQTMMKFQATQDAKKAVAQQVQQAIANRLGPQAAQISPQDLVRMAHGQPLPPGTGPMGDIAGNPMVGGHNAATLPSAGTAIGLSNLPVNMSSPIPMARPGQVTPTPIPNARPGQARPTPIPNAALPPGVDPNSAMGRLLGHMPNLPHLSPVVQLQAQLIKAGILPKADTSLTQFTSLVKELASDDAKYAKLHNDLKLKNVDAANKLAQIREVYKLGMEKVKEQQKGATARTQMSIKSREKIAKMNIQSRQQIEKSREITQKQRDTIKNKINFYKANLVGLDKTISAYQIDLTNAHSFALSDKDRKAKLRALNDAELKKDKLLQDMNDLQRQLDDLNDDMNLYNQRLGTPEPSPSDQLMNKDIVSPNEMDQGDAIVNHILNSATPTPTPNQ